MILSAIFKSSTEDYKVDMAKPLDISMPLQSGSKNAMAWYIDAPKIAPVVIDNWVGSVKEGASTNFNTIAFNPHAHGTHTECVGHITKEFYSINDCLKHFFFIAELITVNPSTIAGDLVITEAQLKAQLKAKTPEAVIIRTLPNTKQKQTKNYSNTNPPYLDVAAANYLKTIGVEHLLIDLPSVDKEKDNGKLLAHNAFWNTSGELRKSATITEFIYVPDNIEDGRYMLNLQIAPFHNDASPSKPILYRIKE